MTPLDEVHKQNSVVYFLSSYFLETVYVGLFSDININIDDVTVGYFYVSNPMLNTLYIVCIT